MPRAEEPIKHIQSKAEHKAQINLRFDLKDPLGSIETKRG